MPWNLSNHSKTCVISIISHHRHSQHFKKFCSIFSQFQAKLNAHLLVFQVCHFLGTQKLHTEQHTLALNNTLQSSRMLQPYPNWKCIVSCSATGILAPLLPVQNLYIRRWHLHIGQYRVQLLVHWSLCTQHRTHISDRDPFTVDSAMLCHWHTGIFVSSAGPIYQTMTLLHWIVSCYAISTPMPLCPVLDVFIRP
jgi:hypothetical protein